jgi:hypothetical protein
VFVFGFLSHFVSGHNTVNSSKCQPTEKQQQCARRIKQAHQYASSQRARAAMNHKTAGVKPTRLVCYTGISHTVLPSRHSIAANKFKHAGRSASNKQLSPTSNEQQFT